MKNIALILAGGVGKRAGIAFPKQFVAIKNKPLIVYTLEKFEQCTAVDAICVVTHRDWIDEISQKETDALILIHDAVRPFVTEKIIVENIKVAEEHGVAVTSIPCLETLIKIDCGKKYSNESVPRDGLMRVMTPQTFRLQVLKQILSSENLDDCIYPSFFALYMSKGFPIFISYGSEKNIKITYPEDIDYLKSLFI